MARTCFVLGRKMWSERRLFVRQVPALVEAGHEVIYMVGDPGKQVTDAFIVHPVPKRQVRLGRYVGSLNLLSAILRIRPDVVHVTSLELVPLGLVLKMLTGIRVVYDCIEDHPSAMRHHRTQFPEWLAVLMGFGTHVAEYLGDRLFDGLVVSDPALARLHYAMPRQRKAIFYNTAPLSMFPRDYAPLADRPFDLCVMGSMSMRTGVKDVVEAVGILKSRGRNTRLMLLGEPDQQVRAVIENMVRKYDIQEQVEITGYIDHAEIPKRLATAKIGVVPLLNMRKFRHNIACKAFEYMACGMPSICSDLPPQHVFIQQGRNGLFYEPGNVSQLADVIESLLANPKRAEEMGRLARDDMERQWNTEQSQKELVRFYDNILHMEPRAAGSWKEQTA